MEADDRRKQPTNFTSIKDIVDHFFINAANQKLEEELWKWFVFSVSGKGLAISDLNAEDFHLFSESLVKMLSSVYRWSNLQKNTPLKVKG